MTPDESALTVLIEEANWPAPREHIGVHNFKGEVVPEELV